MSETANFGLYLTENDLIKFAEWRDKINGPVDSAMVKIDAILASHILQDKENPHKVSAKQLGLDQAVLYTEDESGSKTLTDFGGNPLPKATFTVDEDGILRMSQI